MKPSTSSRWMRFGAPALFLALAVTAAYFVLTVPVHVGAATTRLPRWTTAADILAGGRFTVHPGDLVSAKHHKVLRAGGGFPAFLVANGRALTPTATLRPGDLVVARDGDDRVEPLATREETIAPSTRSNGGTGPLLAVVSKGVAGRRAVTYGTLSGEVVSVRVLKAAVPTVTMHRYAKGARVVALTFDDGPFPEYTERILGILKDNHVRATFFMLGQMAHAYPRIASDVAHAGMLVGNHTDSHPNMPKLGDSAASSEMHEAEDRIQRATGVHAHWFRFPYGSASSEGEAIARDMGLRIARWDIDTVDWRRPSPDKIEARVLGAVHPGAVVLMHDGGGNRASTAAALPGIIAGLKAKGYTLVTLDELPTEATVVP